MIHRSDLERYLGGEKAKTVFADLYGQDEAKLVMQRKRWLRLAKLFAEQYPGQEKVRLFSTPGRTEVGGNHTDHQQGRVLCAAVDFDIIALAAPNDEGIIRLKSEGFSDIDIIDTRHLEPVKAEKEHSASLIRGIAAGMHKRGYTIGGMDVYTTSLVPKGSGLSSSAAFEILVTTILDCLYNDSVVSPVERAVISQEAENQFFGKPSGLMDQCGCSIGGFIAIDFETPGQPVVNPIPFDVAKAGYSLIVTNTGGSHADLTHEYAAVPGDMKAVAAAMGKDVLRQIDEKVFWNSLPQLRENLDDQALLRAIHFFADNARVLRQKEALEKNHFNDFLREVTASGHSSWTLLQNVFAASAPREQPISLGLALSQRILAGEGACRVHGGGFAGTIQAYVPEAKVPAYLQTMKQVFGVKAASLTQIRQTGSTELVLN